MTMTEPITEAELVEWAELAFNQIQPSVTDPEMMIISIPDHKILRLIAKLRRLQKEYEQLKEEAYKMAQLLERYRTHVSEHRGGGPIGVPTP